MSPCSAPVTPTFPPSTRAPATATETKAGKRAAEHAPGHEQTADDLLSGAPKSPKKDRKKPRKPAPVVTLFFPPVSAPSHVLPPLPLFSFSQFFIASSTDCFLQRQQPVLL